MKRNDLAGALRFLKSLESEQPLVNGGSPSSESTRLRFGELERFGPQRDWEVLDTCLNADDMKLVANAYRFLRDRGFLPNFGKSQQDDVSECLVGLNDHFSHLSWILINNNKYKLLMF